MPSSASPIPKQPIGTTFVVAICILGAVALVQIVAVTLVFIRKIPTPAPTAQEEVRQMPVQQTPQFPPASAPGADVTNQARLSIEAERLLSEGQRLFSVGEFAAALDLLTRADELQPDNPETLSRLALASEQVGQNDDAAAYWQRILELGPIATDFRRQAEMKLSLLATITGQRTLPATSMPGISDLRENTGLQPGASLGIIDCRISDPTPDSRIFRISVKSRPDDDIDIADIKINVAIYEKDGENIVLTESTLFSDWLSKPVDWKEDNIEILQVNYTLPTASDDDTPRSYYGYKIEVYYKNQLQDFRTEPADLRELYPPRISLDPLNE